MGLLEALDFHKRLQSSEAEECTKVEYQLYSWGEIYSLFLGDREHSIGARYILSEFPFKLFSSSTPYDDPLPQKLCLTFKAPHEVKKDTKAIHMSGIFPHEIAKEFTAFLALVTRRRVFVGKQIRYDGMPIEQGVGLYQQSYFQEKQRLKEIDSEEIYKLLDNLQVMDRDISNSFILGVRLYHTAIGMMYTDPEFSYLFLVACLEAISSTIYRDYKPENKEEFLDSRFSGWRKPLNSLSQERITELMEVLLRNEKFTFKKLSKFVNEYLPDRFWSETEDDAKPDYYTRIMEPGPDGLGQENFLRSDIIIQDWEKIEKNHLTDVLREIYDARSQLIHEGVRLPPTIVVGHFSMISIEAVVEIMQISQKSRTKQMLQIPPLLTVERLVNYSMVEFLRRYR